MLDSGDIVALLVALAMSRVMGGVMASGTAKLRALAKDADRPAAGSSAVGRSISDDLRRLQRQVRRDLSAEPIIAALVPAISALAAVGRLVSITATRDGRSVRMSVLDGKEWIEFYLEDEDAATSVGEGVVAAFSAS